MSSEYFYDCLNTHNCGYSFTSSKKERRCTRCDSSFIDLQGVESRCEDNRIFDSIEHLKHEYNLNVEIPKDIPEDCNVICYDLVTNFPHPYKEEDGFLYYFSSDKTWCLGDSETLEEEVEWDVRNGYKFAYLRLTTKGNSDVFTPERLLGVETSKGFIIGVLVSNAFADYIKPSYYVYTSESPYKLEDIHKVKFYISDDSDETVSFEEYVNKFYDGGVCGNKQGKVSCL